MNTKHCTGKRLLAALLALPLGVTAQQGEHDHGHGDHETQGGHDHRPQYGHAWVAPPEAVAMANPVQADAGSIRRGQASYQAHCMSCHGATGRGDGPAGRALVPPPADLVAHAAHHSDGDYAWKIRTGNGPMPAFQEVLDESQVWDVVNYLRTLSSGNRSAGHHEH